MVGELYSIGDRSLLGEKNRKVAVVGSRRMTDYGSRVIERIVPGLVEAGVVIVSGFMYGVDQAAHRTCLECGGKTIAVLGWGIDWEVGEDDRALYKQIKEKGLLVSEYGGKLAPVLWKFPQRNRVIAALSDAVLIVEAAEKSGSLVTAKWAIKQKKKLFAVPGPITAKTSWGTNDLIRKGEAELVTGAEGILKYLGVSSTPWYFPLERGNTGGEKKRGLEKAILAVLENEGLLIDEIIKKIRQPIEEVGPVLSRMEMSGAVSSVNGRYFLV